MTERRFKFLRSKMVDGKEEIVSSHGWTTWKVGEWQEETGPIELCDNGFHCSLRAYDAFSYVNGEYLAEVEVEGDSQIQTDKSWEHDKQAWQRMCLVKVYKWSKKDSVAFAEYCAEYAQQFKSRHAAADYADAAADAAYAAYAAYADAAAAAAAAAYAADAAAAATTTAAAAAARRKAWNIFSDWMEAHIAELEEVK
jgi:hypothetical protein